jgi:hypothetical protein
VQDLLQAVRSLRATPIVSIVAALSLAFGIGATTAIFSLYHRLVAAVAAAPGVARAAGSLWTPAGGGGAGLIVNARGRSVDAERQVPLAQSAGVEPPGRTAVTISARSAAGSPAALARGAAAALTGIDRDLAFAFRPLEDQVNASLAQERMVALLAGFFGALALLLAGLGLYGVTASAVARRRAEIGIRMALGAQPAGVIRLVLSRVAILVGIGIVVGATASVWASRFVSALIFGIQPRDPTTLAAAAVVLAAVGASAGWLPAWRASRTDPAQVLRES